MTSGPNALVGPRRRWCCFDQAVLGTAQFLAQGHYARGLIGSVGPCSLTSGAESVVAATEHSSHNAAGVHPDPWCAVLGRRWPMPDPLKVEVPDRAPSNWNPSFRPLASSVRPPGDSRVAWCQQCKGHFLRLMYASENDGHLEVKWRKGRLPPGEVRWARWR